MTENNTQNNLNQGNAAPEKKPQPPQAVAAGQKAGLGPRPSNKGRYRRPHNSSKPKQSQERQNKPVKARRNPLEAGQGRRPYYHRNPTTGERLVESTSGLISHSIKVFVFWILFSLLLFCTGGYLIFSKGFVNWGYPFWALLLAGFFIFGFSALFGFLYGLLMAVLYTIKDFSQNIGSLIRETVNRVKNSIESKIENIESSVSKNEVIGVIKQAFEELNLNIKRYARRTAAGILAVGILGGAIFLARNFFITSANSIKNKAEFFTVLSARVALVLAVILNLTFFARVGIFIWYLIGILALMAQGLIIFSIM